MGKGIILNVKGSEILEKAASEFGNGAHILLPKEYRRKKLKIIVGKPIKVNKNKIALDFFGNEILERVVRKFGTGFHITIPKEQIGKKIIILVGGEK